MFECENCGESFQGDNISCEQCHEGLCEDCFGEDEEICDTCLEYNIEEAGKDADSEAHETSCNDAADDLIDRI